VSALDLLEFLHVGVDEIADKTPGRFLARPPVDSLRPLFQNKDPSFQIENEDRVLGFIQQGPSAPRSALDAVEFREIAQDFRGTDDLSRFILERGNRRRDIKGTAILAQKNSLE
jgi:hypothetical protein